MAALHFRPATELWPLVDRAFQYHSREVRLLVPGAAVEHVGATSIPGALTKGDVDLMVRVPAHEFAAAEKALGGRYAIAEPTAWSATAAHFSDDDGPELPVGIQLVSSGSADEDRIDRLRRLLRRPEVVERCNELKRRHEGGDPGAYARAKRSLYSELLDEGDGALHEQPSADHDEHSRDRRSAVPSEPET